MTRKLSTLLLSLFFVATVITGCGGTAPKDTTAPSTQGTPAQNTAPPTNKPAETKKTTYPLKIKDDAGREVTLNAAPKRIVSVAPSNTELVFALGKGALLVGRSDFCDYPAEAAKIESIGGILKPNYEKIVSLHADLILFIGGSVEVREKLANEYKQTIFVLDPQNFPSLYAGIKSLGVALDAQVEAEKIVSDMQKAVKEISDQAAKAPSKPKVFFEVWDNPLMTAGANTFIDDLIKMAGGVNAGGDVTGWVEYSLEKLQATNPDVLVVGSPDVIAKVKERKGWEGFKAVKESKIYAVADQNHVSRPGPRLVLGLKWFAETIHPELFK